MNRLFKSIITLLLIAGMVVAVVFIYKQIQQNNSRSMTTATGNKFYCPMHPTYVSDREGDCPICQMKLVPIEEDKTEHQPADSSQQSDRTTVRISPERQYLIGVKKEKTKNMQITKEIKTFGMVDYIEPNIHNVNLKFSGWVEVADC
ncbi:MAG: hypothetical protein HY606_15685 [Planctomycetes bacterium]|nr:hypothetical protein [Planctomycetota bacterium]